MEKLRVAKLHPVQVDGSAIDEHKRGHRLIGDIEEYIDALRAIASPVVFIRVDIFEDFHFFHSSEDQDEVDFSDDEADLIDLRSIVPKLRSFEKYLNVIASYRLSASLTTDSLDFVINEPWWLEFLTLREAAVEQVDCEMEVAAAKAHADQQAKDRKALVALSSLINDTSFTRLPTQRAMIAYALEKIPELELVDENSLKIKVQNLHAKIKAKGLDRKH